jgi:hypothetical protein
VVEHESGLAAGIAPKLSKGMHDERLELRHEDPLRAADVTLLPDLLREDVVHGLLLQDPLHVAENPPPIGKLVRRPPLVRLESLDARITQERADLGERHPASAEHRDQRSRVQLIEPVVAIPRVRIDPGGRQQAVFAVHAKCLLRELRGRSELADRHQVLHVDTHDAVSPKGRVNRIAPQMRRAASGRPFEWSAVSFDYR